MGCGHVPNALRGKYQVGAYAERLIQRHNTNIPPRPELDRNLERVLDQNRAQLHTHPVPSVPVLRTRSSDSVVSLLTVPRKEGRNDSLETSIRVQTPLPAVYYTRSHELERATKQKVPNASRRNPVARRRRDPSRARAKQSPQAVMTQPVMTPTRAIDRSRRLLRRLGPPRIFEIAR
jgi:hypothetical protein